MIKTICATLALIFAGYSLSAIASTGDARDHGFKSQRHLQRWINDYRDNPEPELMPGAVHAMRDFGLLENQEKAGTYVGFIAGVIGFNQVQSKKLIKEMFPMPPKEQAVIIKAIAYSGLPEWHALLTEMSERMPARKALIGQYLKDEKKTLLEVALDSDPTIIDTLWGYYVATGYSEPVLRIMQALPWTRDETDLEKITAGHMAKWTLAANAERDRGLLRIYRAEVDHHPKKLRKPLKEVVAAAENFEADKLRKEAVKVISTAKAKTPFQRSKWAFANTVGSTLLSVGCVAAGVLGHPEIAVPCVITGAVSSGAVKLLSLKSDD